MKKNITWRRVKEKALTDFRVKRTPRERDSMETEDEHGSGK